MTKLKLCGLSRLRDIEAANRLMPEYIGFVFARESRRFVDAKTAAFLKSRLHPDILTVGVFVDETPETIAGLFTDGVIDIAQLHGRENEEAIRHLRTLTDKPLIKAFRIDSPQDIEHANASSADYVLLDSGQGGTGAVFDWELLTNIRRPYFLAGGLTAENVRRAVSMLRPYAVDVSSGIETGGYKDEKKMRAFAQAVRGLIETGKEKRDEHD